MCFELFILKVSPIVLPLFIAGMILMVLSGTREYYCFLKFESHITKHYPDIAAEILEKNPFKNSRKYFTALVLATGLQVLRTTVIIRRKH